VIDITLIPADELREDYAGAEMDLLMCEKLLVAMDPKDDRRNIYLNRADINRRVMKVIENEINRRADNASK